MLENLSNENPMENQRNIHHYTMEPEVIGIFVELNSIK